MFNGFKDPTNCYGSQPLFENCSQPAFLPCEASKQTSAPPWDYPTQAYGGVSFFPGDQSLGPRLPPGLGGNVGNVLMHYGGAAASAAASAAAAAAAAAAGHQTVVRPTALINCQTRRSACCSHPSGQGGAPPVPQPPWGPGPGPGAPSSAAPAAGDGARYLATSHSAKDMTAAFPETFLPEDSRFRPPGPLGPAVAAAAHSLTKLSRLANDPAAASRSAKKAAAGQGLEACAIQQYQQHHQHHLPPFQQLQSAGMTAGTGAGQAKTPKRDGGLASCRLVDPAPALELPDPVLCYPSSCAQWSSVPAPPPAQHEPWLGGSGPGTAPAVSLWPPANSGHGLWGERNGVDKRRENGEDVYIEYQRVQQQQQQHRLQQKQQQQQPQAHHQQLHQQQQQPHPPLQKGPDAFSSPHCPEAGRYPAGQRLEVYTTGIAQPPTRFSPHATYTQSKISRTSNEALLGQVCPDSFPDPYPGPYPSAAFSELSTAHYPGLSGPLNMTRKPCGLPLPAHSHAPSTLSESRPSDVIRYSSNGRGVYGYAGAGVQQGAFGGAHAPLAAYRAFPPVERQPGMSAPRATPQASAAAGPAREGCMFARPGLGHPLPGALQAVAPAPERSPGGRKRARPVLDVRHFLATWDEENEDLPATPYAPDARPAEPEPQTEPEPAVVSESRSPGQGPGSREAPAVGASMPDLSESAATERPEDLLSRLITTSPLRDAAETGSSVIVPAPLLDPPSTTAVTAPTIGTAHGLDDLNVRRRSTIVEASQAPNSAPSLSLALAGDTAKPRATFSVIRGPPSAPDPSRAVGVAASPPLPSHNLTSPPTTETPREVGLENATDEVMAETAEEMLDQLGTAGEVSEEEVTKAMKGMEEVLEGMVDEETGEDLEETSDEDLEYLNGDKRETKSQIRTSSSEIVTQDLTAPVQKSRERDCPAAIVQIDNNSTNDSDKYEPVAAPTNVPCIEIESDVDKSTLTKVRDDLSENAGIEIQENPSDKSEKRKEYTSEKETVLETDETNSHKTTKSENELETSSEVQVFPEETNFQLTADTSRLNLADHERDTATQSMLVGSETVILDDDSAECDKDGDSFDDDGDGDENVEEEIVGEKEKEDFYPANEMEDALEAATDTKKQTDETIAQPIIPKTNLNETIGTSKETNYSETTEENAYEKLKSSPLIEESLIELNENNVVPVTEKTLRELSGQDCHDVVCHAGEISENGTPNKVIHDCEEKPNERKLTAGEIAEECNETLITTKTDEVVKASKDDTGTDKGYSSNRSIVEFETIPQARECLLPALPGYSLAKPTALYSAPVANNKTFVEEHPHTEATETDLNIGADDGILIKELSHPIDKKPAVLPETTIDSPVNPDDADTAVFWPEKRTPVQQEALCLKGKSFETHNVSSRAASDPVCLQKSSPDAACVVISTCPPTHSELVPVPHIESGRKKHGDAFKEHMNGVVLHDSEKRKSTPPGKENSSEETAALHNGEEGCLETSSSAPNASNASHSQGEAEEGNSCVNKDDVLKNQIGRSPKNVGVNNTPSDKQDVPMTSNIRTTCEAPIAGEKVQTPQNKDIKAADGPQNKSAQERVMQESYREVLSTEMLPRDGAFQSDVGLSISSCIRTCGKTAKLSLCVSDKIKCTFIRPMEKREKSPNLVAESSKDTHTSDVQQNKTWKVVAGDLQQDPTKFIKEKEKQVPGNEMSERKPEDAHSEPVKPKQDPTSSENAERNSGRSIHTASDKKLALGAAHMRMCDLAVEKEFQINAKRIKSLPNGTECLSVITEWAEDAICVPIKKNGSESLRLEENAIGILKQIQGSTIRAFRDAMDNVANTSVTVPVSAVDLPKQIIVFPDKPDPLFGDTELGNILKEANHAPDQVTAKKQIIYDGGGGTKHVEKEAWGRIDHIVTNSEPNTCRTIVERYQFSGFKWQKSSVQTPKNTGRSIKRKHSVIEKNVPEKWKEKISKFEESGNEKHRKEHINEVERKDAVERIMAEHVKPEKSNEVKSLLEASSDALQRYIKGHGLGENKGPITRKECQDCFYASKKGTPVRYQEEKFSDTKTSFVESQPTERLCGASAHSNKAYNKTSLGEERKNERIEDATKDVQSFGCNHNKLPDEYPDMKDVPSEKLPEKTESENEANQNEEVSPPERPERLILTKLDQAEPSTLDVTTCDEPNKYLKYIQSEGPETNAKDLSSHIAETLFTEQPNGFEDKIAVGEDMPHLEVSTVACRRNSDTVEMPRLELMAGAPDLSLARCSTSPASPTPLSEAVLPLPDAPAVPSAAKKPRLDSPEDPLPADVQDRSSATGKPSCLSGGLSGQPGSPAKAEHEGPPVLDGQIPSHEDPPCISPEKLTAPGEEGRGLESKEMGTGVAVSEEPPVLVPEAPCLLPELPYVLPGVPCVAQLAGAGQPLAGAAWALPGGDTLHCEALVAMAEPAELASCLQSGQLLCIEEGEQMEPGCDLVTLAELTSVPPEDLVLHSDPSLQLAPGSPIITADYNGNHMSNTCSDKTSLGAETWAGQPVPTELLPFLADGSMSALEILPAETVSNWPYLEEEVSSEPAHRHPALASPAPSSTPNSTGDGSSDASSSDLRCRLSWKKIFDLSRQRSRRRRRAHRVSRSGSEVGGRRGRSCSAGRLRTPNPTPPPSPPPSPPTPPASPQEGFSCGGLELGPAKIGVRMASPAASRSWQVVDASAAGRRSPADRPASVPAAGRGDGSVPVPIVLVRRLVLRCNGSRDGGSAADNASESCGSVARSPTPMPSAEDSTDEEDTEEERDTEEKKEEEDSENEDGGDEEEEEAGQGAAPPPRPPRVVIRRTRPGGGQFRSFLCGAEARWQPIVTLRRSPVLDQLAQRLAERPHNNLRIRIATAPPVPAPSSQPAAASQSLSDARDPRLPHTDSTNAQRHTKDEAKSPNIDRLSMEKNVKSVEANKDARIIKGPEVMGHPKEDVTKKEISNSEVSRNEEGGGVGRKLNETISTGSSGKRRSSASEAAFNKRLCSDGSARRHSWDESSRLSGSCISETGSMRFCSDKSTAKHQPQKALPESRQPTVSSPKEHFVARIKRNVLEPALGSSLQNLSLEAVDNRCLGEDDRHLEAKGSQAEWDSQEATSPQQRHMPGAGSVRPEDVVSCAVCGYQFRNASDRAAHVRQHSYHCQRCDLAFRSQADFVAHLSAQHPATRERHHCLLCARSFPSAARHQLHVRGRLHRALEALQRRTVHALFSLLTGHPCPGISPLSPSERAAQRWLPAEPGAVHFYHQATPLQMSIQDWTSRQREVTVPEAGRGPSPQLCKDFSDRY